MKQGKRLCGIKKGVIYKNNKQGKVSYVPGGFSSHLCYICFICYIVHVVFDFFGYFFEELFLVNFRHSKPNILRSSEPFHLKFSESVYKLL